MYVENGGVQMRSEYGPSCVNSIAVYDDVTNDIVHTVHLFQDIPCLVETARETELVTNSLQHTEKTRHFSTTSF